MKSVLKKNNYGKSAVRVLKVKRTGLIHDITELSIDIQLKGDFDDVHLKGDNNKVLPTDTIKNTVYVLAKENPVNSIEEFCLYLGNYFLDNNIQISEVRVKAVEKIWKRINIHDSSDNDIHQHHPHNHSFISPGNETRNCSLKISKDDHKIKSGLNNLLVLKTTNSGFEGFIKDKYTTLLETKDRIFSTSIKAEWKYFKYDIDFRSIHDTVRNLILNTFAEHSSLSVQQTLYECGKKVTGHCPEIKEIFISMPNKHYLKFDLDRFDLDNFNEIFIPTDEPFGLIEGVVKNVINGNGQ